MLFESRAEARDAAGQMRDNGDRYATDADIKGWV